GHRVTACATAWERCCRWRVMARDSVASLLSPWQQRGILAVVGFRCAGAAWELCCSPYRWLMASAGPQLGLYPHGAGLTAAGVASLPPAHAISPAATSLTPAPAAPKHSWSEY